MTLGFALLDSASVRSRIERALSDWNPHSLPPLLEEEPSRPPTVARLLLDLLLSVWWLLGLRFPSWILGPAAAYVAFGPVFQALFVPMAIVAAARFLRGWIHLTRPHLTRLH